jgi:hypothetical protein
LHTGGTIAVQGSDELRRGMAGDNKTKQLEGNILTKK